MDIEQEVEKLNLNINRSNLYREEVITDLEAGSIRKLVPISPDGAQDTSRSPVFMGSTTLMTPEGPLPIQARLMGNDLTEAMDDYPRSMKIAVMRFVEAARKMQQENDSRIIVPGRE